MGLEKLTSAVEAFKAEYDKFNGGNKSAGTRARKELQNVKKAAQELRNEIQEKKKQGSA